MSSSAHSTSLSTRAQKIKETLLHLCCRIENFNLRLNLAQKPLKSPETSSTTRLDRSTAARGHVTPTRSHVTKNSVPAPELLPRNATQELRYGRAFYDKPTILRPYEVP